MAKRYDPILCMMVDKPDKAQDELSLAQKKQVVTELKGYLKKSYNFSDESEYARAYEDLRHMFTTGSRKSISGLFENTVKKTGAHDAKVKDKLVKVPDSKLKDFEASLRSAGFKVVSKSDRGKSTHYQVEVNSSKQFTESDLREWANKIDAVCDKMDSVAPTTWNIGLTSDGKITAGLDVREMYVKDSASALDEAIKTTDAEGERWITMRGSHVKIDGEGNAVAGNERVKNIINSRKAGASKESSASENNKQNANKGKADAEKTKKVDNVMKKYGDRHSYSSALRDMLSLSVDIGKKYDEDGIIDNDDVKQYKQKYDKLLDFHMDYDISKTTMNKINTDLIRVLKDYGLDKYQLKSFGWAYTGRDSMPALDKAIRNCDAEGERWITIRGSHVKIDGEGNAVAGNPKVKSIVNSKKQKETAVKSEKKQTEESKKETYKSYSDFKKNSGAEDLIQFVDEVAFDAGRDEKDPDKDDLKRIGKEFKDVYEKIKDHPDVGEYVNKMRREMNSKFEEEIGTSLYDYSWLGVKELDETLKIFNKYYD